LGRTPEQFIGLDESFSVKSYYPQLKARLKDLEEERTRVQESEALLQAVFRNLPFAFWSADAGASSNWQTKRPDAATAWSLPIPG
jgi:hypothetical protein